MCSIYKALHAVVLCMVDKAISEEDACAATGASPYTFKKWRLTIQRAKLEADVALEQAMKDCIDCLALTMS